ncbi:hypothetical protein [Marinomonas gallaica]|uniref:hypothetical protein n=1 Tax=Marinomonas gallaica TaxID=1806667 RepID=UPI003A9093C1
MHPISALITGGIAGILFTVLFTWINKIALCDDVLGVYYFTAFVVLGVVLLQVFSAAHL